MKKYAVTTAPDIILLAINELNVLICVIGGMTVKNSRPLIALGAPMMAVMSSVDTEADHRLAARKFSQMFE